MDGDSLTVEWSAGGGSINDPYENPMIWSTHDAGGLYSITAVVEDGYGGLDSETQLFNIISMTAYAPMLLHSSDIGNVIAGDGVNTESLIIGNSIQNKPVMGYFVFNLSSLAGKKVNRATLRIVTFRMYSNLWSCAVMGFIRIGLRDYLPLDPDDFIVCHGDYPPYLFRTDNYPDDTYTPIILPQFLKKISAMHACRKDTMEFSSNVLRKSIQQKIDIGEKIQFYLLNEIWTTDIEVPDDHETDGREFTKDSITLIIDYTD